MKDIRQVSAAVATAVGIQARDSGLSRLLDDEQIGRIVRKAQWYPSYASYRPGRPGHDEA
jgi:malic enzyme